MDFLRVNLQTLLGPAPGVCGRKIEMCYCVHRELVVLRGGEIALISSEKTLLRSTLLSASYNTIFTFSKVI